MASGRRGRGSGSRGFSLPLANFLPSLNPHQLSVIQTHLPVHASGSAPRFDHARLPIPSLSHEVSAGARNRATVMTSLRWPVRHVSVHRSVSIHVHELGLSAPIPVPDVSGPGRTGLCARQRTPDNGLATTARGDPFSRTPDAGLCVVSPHQAPVPSRHDASRCSRGRDEVILAQFQTPWKIGVKPLILFQKARTVLNRRIRS